MTSLDTEDSVSLSPEGLQELTHSRDEVSELEDEGPLSFADPGPPITRRTVLGKRILDVGMALCNKPLLEDAGPNEDRAGVIRSLFLEGVPWPARYWDEWMQIHPKSDVPRPAWCAAFAAYCVRKGYASSGLSHKLPKTLSASTSELRSLFRSLGRFIERDALFDDAGCIRPGAPLPAPGDIVLWQGHTGLLYDLYADGSYQTLEGNTRPTRDKVPGVYLLPNSSKRKVEQDGRIVWSLTGFCRLPSVDG